MWIKIVLAVSLFKYITNVTIIITNVINLNTELTGSAELVQTQTNDRTYICDDVRFYVHRPT